MTYFRNFPITTYKLGTFNKVTKDILIRSKAVDRLKNNIDFYQTYTVKDSERPEHVANKFYNNPELHWVILLFNEIHDPYYEWPLSQNELTDYCKKIYGETEMYFVRHYEREGLIVGQYREFNKDNPTESWIPPENPGPQDPSIYPVSFIEWEERINDSKREIKILRPELLSDFISEFEDSLNNDR